jgi:hypothetical protein
VLARTNSSLLDWTRISNLQREIDSGAMSCKSVASQRGQEPLNTEAEESILLGAVSRQRPVKTNIEDLTFAVVRSRVRELMRGL